MIELWVAGQVADIAPDTRVTLAFKSNIFGDISKIEPSHSFTINLPKTPKNNGIFGAPMNTSAAYRRWEARLYINGVTVVDTAYLVLLSVGETYEVALYWGVVKGLYVLKESEKALPDIEEVLHSQYGKANGEDWWSDWEAQYGKDKDGNENANLINAMYEAGIGLLNDSDARKKAALLPSVRARWVWDNIIRESGLVAHLDSDVRATLNQIAIPFTTHNTSSAEPFSVAWRKANKRYRKRETEGYIGFYDVTDYPISAYYDFVTENVKIGGNLGIYTKVDMTFYKCLQPSIVRAKFRVVGTWDKQWGQSGALIVEHRRKDEVVGKEGISLNKNIDTSLIIEVTVEERDVLIPYVWWNGVYGKQEDMKIESFSAEFEVFSEEGETVIQSMGGEINTRNNLPDISYIDFVKAVCEMFGLWATAINGEVYFLPYATLYNRNNPILDWSHKLVSTGDFDASKTTYTLADYAQRNTLNYKEDDTVKVDANGALLVDNETLDKEKEMVVLPFAASDGNIIPHLKWKDDDRNTYEVEDVDIEPRIMALSEGMDATTLKPFAKLSFKTLSFNSLIASYYSTWQKIMRNPVIIEEKVMISEIDIANLDYRSPVYLQKYGALFAIDSVQWNEGEASTVTLVQLPPAQEIGVALPYTVTTGVKYGASIGGSDNTMPEWAYLVSGGGEYFASSAMVRFNDRMAEAISVKFVRWVSDAGVTISTDNPYYYDGSNGDIELYAEVIETLS